MTPLAWFLSAILVASIACCVASSRLDTQDQFKLVICIYSVLVFIIPGSMVYYFIGWDGRGNPRVPKELQRRVAHAGYYFARDGQLRLVGKPFDASAFEQPEATHEVDIIRRLMPTEASDDAGGAQTTRQDSRAADLEGGSCTRAVARRTPHLEASLERAQGC